mmetsp:Transcript_5914/g.9640  ORF Transcript_5914/g.9640 Transcript_5914/m.9640 type:complete len:170 (+) Transcript_5914:2274-2783(+)|eukprot:CAMPEP_0170501846 /NCGR_PEP_ID=MMETSP0208-20121228/39616_1 /TAXON_ID=197538 /ORGANISM="Strombidium inclinatum, Strain S3" /LENGTH=169 /DNA_ID=CAMNT_0010780589 /DNA_START=2190 /DNA_END=2699 /DNA_ORIENTATION=+
MEKVAQLDDYKLQWNLQQDELTKNSTEASGGFAALGESTNKTEEAEVSPASDEIEADDGILTLKEVLVPALKGHFLVFHLALILYPIGVTLYSKILQDSKTATLPDEVRAVRIAPNEDPDLGISSRQILNSEQDQSAIGMGDPFGGSQNEIQEVELVEIDGPPDIENDY